MTRDTMTEEGIYKGRGSSDGEYQQQTAENVQIPGEPDLEIESQTGDRTVESYPVTQQEDSCDEADGFIAEIFKPPKGTYNPRQQEIESWGPSIDYPEGAADCHDAIAALLQHTSPRARWREGLLLMLREASSEQDTRKLLAFLHSTVFSGIKTLNNDAVGNFVPIDASSAPKCVTIADWILVMEGLDFVLTSPGTVRDIEYVDVTTCSKTDHQALEGFCHLMKAMLDMSWTNLQQVVRLKETDGILLHNTLAILCSGLGLDQEHYQDIDDMDSRYPYLIKSLGFRRQKPYDRLQWQQPEPDTEFRCLCHILHGLYMPVDKIESTL